MLHQHDLGRSLYKTWSDEQKRDEIAKLVEGYRNGLPFGILCNMVEAISGSQKQAREHLMSLLTVEERKKAMENEVGGMKLIAESLLF